MNRTNNFDQFLSINSNFFCYDIEKYIYLFKIRQIIGINLNNPKGASFKENHPMTTTPDALRTTCIFRFRTFTNNLNFLNQSKHVWNDRWLKLIYMPMSEMPVPSQVHYGFPSFPVVDWFCLFIYLWVLPFPLEDCSEFCNFVITLNYNDAWIYVWP